MGGETFLFVAGGGLLGLSLLGKGGIHFYRMVKSGNAFDKATKVEAYYQGGFEKAMTKREAALILGCREAAEEDKI